MATKNSKRSRNEDIAALQKLSDGFTLHASTVPPIVLAGVTFKPTDVTAKLQVMITQSKAVLTTEAAWHNAVQAESTAWKQLTPFLQGVEQILRNAYDGKIDVLADFGLTPRKKPVVPPATRTAAALKAKETRAARGTKGPVQKAGITTQVQVTPAAVKSVTVDGVQPADPTQPVAEPAAPPAPVATTPANPAANPGPSPTPNTPAASAPAAAPARS
ncbi:MAG: hypothetical protein ACRENE_32690 [Polyangiaceae bacterium]